MAAAVPQLQVQLATEAELAAQLATGGCKRKSMLLSALRALVTARRQDMLLTAVSAGRSGGSVL